MRIVVSGDSSWRRSTASPAVLLTALNAEAMVIKSISCDLALNSIYTSIRYSGRTAEVTNLSGSFTISW